MAVLGVYVGSALQISRSRLRDVLVELWLDSPGRVAAMDVDLKHLQKVEAGQLNLTMVTILRIADGFDVAPESLFAGVPVRSKRKARTKTA